MKKRIYVVENTSTGQQELVRAANRVAARNTVARDIFAVEVADQDTLFKLAAKGQAIRQEAAPDEQPALDGLEESK